MKLEIFTLFCFLFFVSCELNCYDCDPTFVNKCQSPDANNVRTTICEDKAELVTAGSGFNTGPLEFECFTLYLQNTTGELEDTSGIYRGCFWKHVGETSCDNLRKQFGNVALCETCLSNQCNTKNLGADPRDDDNDDNDNGGPNGGAAFSLSLVILFLNMVLLARMF